MPADERAGSGEWCVDYALRLKRELGADSTWVSSYNSELIAYVPSARVKAEGGMEAGEAMLEYRNPAPFGEEVEEVIVAKVHELVASLKGSGEREKKRRRTDDVKPMGPRSRLMRILLKAEKPADPDPDEDLGYGKMAATLVRAYEDIMNEAPPRE